MDFFARSSAALHAAVDELTDDEFAAPSGCSGWLVRDLVCHLVIDAQDVLITLVTPTDEPATRDAYTYWTVESVPPTGDDPLNALIVRLAAADPPPDTLAHARVMLQTIAAGFPRIARRRRRTTCRDGAPRADPSRGGRPRGDCRPDSVRAGLTTSGFGFVGGLATVVDVQRVLLLGSRDGV